MLRVNHNKLTLINILGNLNNNCVRQLVGVMSWGHNTRVSGNQILITSLNLKLNCNNVREYGKLLGILNCSNILISVLIPMIVMSEHGWVPNIWL